MNLLVYSLVSMLSLITQISQINCNNIEVIGSNEITNNNKHYTIDGKVIVHSDMIQSMNHFLTNTKVIANYGQHFAFLRSDGSFSMTHLTPGSYLLEISNPDYFYEPIRVDINSKGKTRARKVNYIQTSAVQQLSYPLKFKTKGHFKYFQIRETWKITDFLLNPMVLMMVLPLLLIMVLPKMMNSADADTQREMQNMQMPKYDVPELSEMMTSWFTGGPKTQNTKSKEKSKKRQ
ncbi:ER membrane protein complex subunit 7 homolog [Oppia nitens]|uniref:ER membrane protein complex subunit 7 homolog n=1 Tax=Oppia nitens TaxID=1686743 RepID=UPI0023DB2484|nr:ER membrane protein complex subunit 7 homolog [Oppia nitens]